MSQSTVSSAPVRRGAEHRRYLRIPLDLAVSYRVADGESQTGRTGNISVGGIFIVTTALPDIGAPVTCELRENDAVVLSATGAVRWHKTEGQRGFGIQLDPLDKQAHRHVLGIIDTYLQTAPPFPDPDPPAPSRRPDRWKVIAAASIAVALGTLAWALMLRGT